jgi:anti-sigma regulatory factor (Ser/Thr protein kinase)
MNTTIKIPDTLTASSVFAFLPKMQSVKDSPRIIIDFDALKFALPYGSLLLACFLKDWMGDRAHRGYRTELLYPKERESINYLGHIGFFKFIGHEYGKEPGEAAGGGTYIPIRIIDKNDLDHIRGSNSEPAGKTISKVAKELTEVLTQKNQFKVNAPISYCFREIIRNVFEHAATDRCFLCAQRWSDEVEIAIIDQGRGIPESLHERYDFKSPEEALRAAIKPGISRSIPSKDDDEWANSGFGLYVLSEIGSKLGAFSISSRGASLEVDESGVDLSDRSFPGTAIRLRMTRPKGLNFQVFIEEIIAEGEKFASGEGRRTQASKSSRITAYKG